MALDEPKENDVLRNINGIEVAIENRILSHTQNLTLDFKETASGPHLVIKGSKSSHNGCC
jgi:Fe-S cluster assembly iron-binding protein IscA